MSLDVAGETVTLSLELPKAVYTRLSQLAKRAGRSEAFLGAYMLEDYLPAMERETTIMEKCIAEANDPNTKWISQEDMEAWLDSWGTDHELPPPGE